VWQKQATDWSTGRSSSMSEDNTWDQPFPPSADYLHGSTLIELRQAKISASTWVEHVPAHLTADVSGTVETAQGAYPINIPYDPFSLPLKSISNTWDLPGPNASSYPWLAIFKTSAHLSFRQETH